MEEVPPATAPANGAAPDSDDEGARSPETSDDGAHWEDVHPLGSSLGGDALARSLVSATTKNELGLVRSEVSRLRCKVDSLMREKDDMVDNFRETTRILINRIKELEGQVSGSSRPQTAAVLDHIENPSKLAARPPKALSRGSSRSGGRHTPEVMTIDEEPSEEAAAQADASEPAEPAEMAICGNCRREIPAGNLVSHTVYCTRNYFHCSACDTVVALSDRDSHRDEWIDPERLIVACADRDVETMRIMAEHGLEFSGAQGGEFRDTVMHVAARLGDVELVSFFMGYGVDVDPTNGPGDTPLHLAAESAPGGEALTVTVRLLVELGADLNVLNSRGESPLMLCCRRDGGAHTARYLLEMRADAEACTRLGDTPLQIAQRLGHQDTVMALATAGAPLRSGTPSRRTPVMSRDNSPGKDSTPRRDRRDRTEAASSGADRAADRASGGYPQPPLPRGRKPPAAPQGGNSLSMSGRGEKLR